MARIVNFSDLLAAATEGARFTAAQFNKAFQNWETAPAKVKSYVKRAAKAGELTAANQIKFIDADVDSAAASISNLSAKAQEHVLAHFRKNIALFAKSVPTMPELDTEFYKAIGRHLDEATAKKLLRTEMIDAKQKAALAKKFDLVVPTVKAAPAAKTTSAKAPAAKPTARKSKIAAEVSEMFEHVEANDFKAARTALRDDDYIAALTDAVKASGNRSTGLSRAINSLLSATKKAEAEAALAKVGDALQVVNAVAAPVAKEKPAATSRRSAKQVEDELEDDVAEEEDETYEPAVGDYVVVVMADDSEYEGNVDKVMTRSITVDGTVLKRSEISSVELADAETTFDDVAKGDEVVFLTADDEEVVGVVQGKNETKVKVSGTVYAIEELTLVELNGVPVGGDETEEVEDSDLEDDEGLDEDDLGDEDDGDLLSDEDDLGDEDEDDLLSDEDDDLGDEDEDDLLSDEDDDLLGDEDEDDLLNEDDDGDDDLDTDLNDDLDDEPEQRTRRSRTGATSAKPKRTIQQATSSKRTLAERDANRRRPEPAQVQTRRTRNRR